MAITGRSLEKAAHTFCDRLNRLVNKTVTQARIMPTSEGRRIAVNLREGGLPGAVVRTKYGELILSLQQLLDGVKDGRRVKLRTVRYRYALSSARDADAFIRWDYCCEEEHAERMHCRHHIQGSLPVRLPAGTSQLNDFHMPTGYVAIEEVLRFLLVDLEVPPLDPDGWDALLRDSAREFRAQLYEVD